MPPEGSRKGTFPRSPSMQSNIKEETLIIHRDGILNGNEIGENIPTVAGKSRHGVYINRAPDKQGTAKEVPRRDG